MREKEETMFRDIDLPVAEAIVQDRNRRAAEFRLEHQARTHSRGLTRRGPNIAPAKEKEFRCLQSWLAASDRLDQLIEATEPSGERGQVPTPAPVVTTVAQRAAAPPAGLPPRRLAADAPTSKQFVVGGLARRTGQALRRIGEGLEKWGGAVPTGESDPA
jgi:hypothetical protein